jgi:hypothetical protein
MKASKFKQLLKHPGMKLGITITKSGGVKMTCSGDKNDKAVPKRVLRTIGEALSMGLAVLD